MDQEKDVVIFLGFIWRRVYLGKKLLIAGFRAGLCSFGAKKFDLAITAMQLRLSFQVSSS